MTEPAHNTYVHSSPSMEYEIIDRVHPNSNESLELINWTCDGVWCDVFYNGDSRRGWLHGRFIRGL